MEVVEVVEPVEGDDVVTVVAGLEVDDERDVRVVADPLGALVEHAARIADATTADATNSAVIFRGRMRSPRVERGFRS